MAQQKVDQQKIMSLKAKVYDEMSIVEQNQAGIRKCQEKIAEYNQQILAEQQKVNTNNGAK